MQVLGQVTAETEDLRLSRPSRRQPFRCRRHHFGGVSAGAGEPAPVRMARRGRVRDWKGSRQCPLRPLPNPPAFAKGSQPSRPTCGRRIEVFLIPHFACSMPWKRASPRADCSCSAKGRRVKSCRAGRWRFTCSWMTSTPSMRKRLRRAVSRSANQPSGDRMAFVEDALGNQWYITRPASPE